MDAKTKITNSHMKPEFEFGSCWEIETKECNTYFIPESVQTYKECETIEPDFIETFRDYVDGEIVDAQYHENVVCWRLSASGYTDATDWAMTDGTLYDAIADLIEQHGEFDLPDLLETHTEIDLGELVDHYFIAMAFTGHRTTPATNINSGDCEGNDKPLVDNPGGDICDVIDGDDVRGWLEDDTVCDLTGTVIEFTLEACRIIGGAIRDAGLSPDWESEIDWSRMGTDFHFTRNGHGAGFWDGDWEIEFDDNQFDFGDQLSELSKPYGTCEIGCHGWHIDDAELQDNYHGTDVDLETSLFEYGLIWSNETDSDGDIRFRYPVRYDNPNNPNSLVPTHFSWGCLKPCEHTEEGFRDQFGWVDWDDLFRSMDIDGFDTWLEYDDYGMMVADIVRHYGIENVFGTDYCGGNRIHTDDLMTCEVHE